MKLWLIVTALILSCPACKFVGEHREREARRAEYAARMADCLQRYPHYRCRIELAEIEPKEDR